jgi:lipoprotein-releasing system permease protein
VSVRGGVRGGALTVVLSVTTGFQQQFREKVLGGQRARHHHQELERLHRVQEVEKLAWKIDSEVLAVQPFIFVEMLVTRGKGDVSGVAIKGVDPARLTKVLDLHKHMIAGSVDALKVRPASRGSCRPSSSARCCRGSSRRRSATSSRWWRRCRTST